MTLELDMGPGEGKLGLIKPLTLINSRAPPRHFDRDFLGTYMEEDTPGMHLALESFMHAAFLCTIANSENRMEHHYPIQWPYRILRATCS